jgi:hypothetical protein
MWLQLRTVYMGLLMRLCYKYSPIREAIMSSSPQQKLTANKAHMVQPQDPSQPIENVYQQIQDGC